MIETKAAVSGRPTTICRSKRPLRIKAGSNRSGLLQGANQYDALTPGNAVHFGKQGVDHLYRPILMVVPNCRPIGK